MWDKKKEKSADTFWQDYEEQTGEKVLERGLGKYVSGWKEFDEKKLGGIWGLVITTSGGFRFHHFPQHTWIDAFTSFAAKEPPKEKTIFIPKEKIISTDFIKETKWWRKIFISSVPLLIVRYAADVQPDDEGGERRLVFEAEYNSK